ncbi:MAG TPA: hypothetical protein VLG40_02920 [Candidatus Saccharimonas sp.]|nr:hypothetical protein [Candidatus Saccharimonas sp.]
MRIFTVKGDIPDAILQAWLDKAKQEGWAASCVEDDDGLTLTSALGIVLPNSTVGQSLRRHGFVMLTDLEGVPVEQFLTLLAEGKMLIERSLVGVFQAMADRNIGFADGDPEDFMAITVRPEHFGIRFYKILKRTGLLSYALTARLSDEFFKKHVQYFGGKTIETLRLWQAEYLKR